MSVGKSRNQHGARRQGKSVPLYVGGALQRSNRSAVTGGTVGLLGQEFYRIGNVDQMPPFFMTLVSDSNHWAFLSSTGGITAGRVDSNQAIFPYYTNDKIEELADITGGKTLLRVRRKGKDYVWEPFSVRLEGVYRTERNLYKNVIGNAVIFEEINQDLGLTFRVAWRNSDRYGWVRTAWLRNQASQRCVCHVLDGLQNLLPWGINANTQSGFSNLLDAYKRSELDSASGLGLFALSSILTDCAEPSEALKVTTVWQEGLDAARYSLSAGAVSLFRQGRDIEPATDVRGERGAFLVHSTLTLGGGEEREWNVVAEVTQDHAAVVRMKKELLAGRPALRLRLLDDIQRGADSLTQIVAEADGLQRSADRMMSAHHFANTLFNVMRGGTFAAGYSVSREELQRSVKSLNQPVFEQHRAFFEALPPEFSCQTLLAAAMESGSPDLERLCGQYLPLSFSRRHGDPSRPWNQFSIRLKKADGTRDLRYEGNWRDIFQNWEGLGYAFPGYIENFVRTFLSATTADGYNPYRISDRGVDWDKPEPHNPWANIGYWSDHQIIYLEKLLEALEAFNPEHLRSLLDHTVFSHVNGPYRIREYAALLQDARTTIDFDSEVESLIAHRVNTMGADGRLVLDQDDQVVHVSLVEKVLILMLAKFTNFVPEGGIWMNTQRPEWNDANNALVGKGLSMVTVCYLRRMVAFVSGLLERDTRASFEISDEVVRWLDAIKNALDQSRRGLAGGFTDTSRRTLMDALGTAGSAYRKGLYSRGCSGKQRKVTRKDLLVFLALARRYVEQTIIANRRKDGLYHSYNILHLSPGKAAVTRLDEMLEGQVAVLSSGLLAPRETLKVLKALRSSQLYRADQNSYILYPNRVPPGFMARNRIDPVAVAQSDLLTRLIGDGDQRLVVRDEDGHFHFNGNFHNERDLAAVLDQLRAEPRYKKLVVQDQQCVAASFENTFNHSSFTGRAGSFFAYEGLGSIYWHMVAKLLLAVQENHALAVQQRAPGPVTQALAEHYYDIRNGLGFNKSPGQYGAFPSDPYSHTPWGRGARQPGMTGQVKEELLTRLGEFGVVIRNGRLAFEPTLLRKQEWLSQSTNFTFYPGKSAKSTTLTVPKGGLVFTLCQTPVVYRQASTASIKVVYADGTVRVMQGRECDDQTCQDVFSRNGHIKEIHVEVGP